MKQLIPSLNKKFTTVCIFVFAILGPYCLHRAYLLHGIAFTQESFSKILSDPIYQYAVIDLGFIFSLFSFWIYQECKVNKQTYWYWPFLLFIFGSPGLLLYLYFRKNESKL